MYQNFINKFNLPEIGFFDLTKLIDTKIGFSAKKKLNEADNDNVTLITIYIPDKILETKDLKKVLNINLTYGKAVDGAVSLRENPKLNEPIDVTSSDEYYYNTSTEKFFKKDQEIEANQIIKDVYAAHIKSTKKIKGLFIRNKIIFYRTFLNSVLRFVSKTFSFLLKIISGDVYKYDINDSIDRAVNQNEAKEVTSHRDDNPGDKISFLGYHATPACIMFYSVFHFLIFLLFYYFNFKPPFLITIFKNSFTTLIYVMMSLIIIDKVFPELLKKMIIGSFELSIYFLHKRIKL